MNPRLRQFIELLRDYAFVSACVVVVAVTGTAGYFLHKNVLELENTVNAVHAEGDAMLKTLAGAGALRADREAIATAVHEINANLITEENRAENVGYFYKLEDQSHTRISELHQLAAPVGSGNSTAKIVPFSVSVSGSYRDVLSFVSQLEQGPRLMRIIAFTFDRRSSSGDSVVLTLSIEMLARP